MNWSGVVAAGLAAVLAVALLGRWSARATGHERAATRWLLAGALATPLIPLGGAIAAAVAAALLTTGAILLSRLWGLREVLDGLMVGATAYFIAGLPTPEVALDCAGWGIALVLALRARGAWARAVVLATTIGLAVTGPLLLSRYAYAPALLIALCLGVAALLPAGSTGRPAGVPTYGAVPTLLTVAGTAYVLVLGRHIPLTIVVLLGARLALALWDAHRYADRLTASEAHFREMANTDPLTGLANRRRLWDALAALPPDTPYTLLALDVDDFKGVNDMCGHDVGDAVLVEVGQRLRDNLRPDDLAARLGGDEFAVLVAAPAAAVRPFAERLLARLSTPYRVGEGLLNLSASIGSAPCDSAPDADGRMRNADLALRFAKKNGKARVEPFALAYDRWLQRRLTIERALRGALENEDLRLVYQPVVALPSGRPVGAEALLRWNHPELGPLSPSEFVPVAEEAGLVAELGAWVRNQACRQLSRWLSDGHDLWMSVNVSVRELRAPDFIAQVVDVLRAHDVPPGRLTLELTEHHVAQDVEELAWTLVALREVGVRVALDDFGAGYSSLGQLRQLAVDVLKIDRALVTERLLVDVVVRLGNKLGLDVIAEGVEEAEHRAVAERARCLLGQGYLFGRPVPAEDWPLLGDPPVSAVAGAGSHAGVGA